MNDATTQFIERFGAFLEADGYAPVAGRLFALLLITDGSCALDELADRLAVTKASISINARILEQRGVLERVTHPGDRRDHYRIAPDILARSMEQRLARWQRFHDALAAAKDTPVVRNKVIRKRLDTLEQAYEHMLHVTTRALEEWRARHPEPTTTPRRPR